MEKEFRPIGNGFDEIVFTCTSVTERDHTTKAVPLVCPDTHEMQVLWFPNEMSWRVRCVAKPEPAPVAAAAPAAPAETTAKTVAPAGQPAVTTTSAPPLTGLLAGDKAALSNAKLADLETACVAEGCPVVVDKRPRANIVADILKWREGRTEK